jgi:hypothetical protein
MEPITRTPHDVIEQLRGRGSVEERLPFRQPGEAARQRCPFDPTDRGVLGSLEPLHLAPVHAVQVTRCLPQQGSATRPGVEAKPGDHLVPEPDERRTQVGQGVSIVARIDEQAQNGDEVEDLQAVRQAEARRVVGRDPRLPKSPVHLLEPSAGTGQHGDVRPTHRAMSVGRVRIGQAAVRQEGANPAPNETGLEGTPGVGRAALDGTVEPVDTLAHVRGAVCRERTVADAPGRIEPIEGRARRLDRGRGGPVDELDDSRLRTKVDGELERRAVAAQSASCIVPHGDVGAAKPVDTLPGVADQHEPGRRSGGGFVDPGEGKGDVALRRVGVLELVDDQNPQSAPDRQERRAVLRIREQTPHVEHETVEVTDVLLLHPAEPRMGRSPGQAVQRAGQRQRRRVRRVVDRLRIREPPFVDVVMPADLANDRGDGPDQARAASARIQAEAFQERLDLVAGTSHHFQHFVADDLVQPQGGLPFIQHPKRRIDAQAQRVIPQKAGAEGVNRPHGHSVELPAKLRGALRGHDPRAQAFLQLARRLLGERDGGNLFQPARGGARRDRPSVRTPLDVEAQEPGDLPHDRPGLSGSGARRQEHVSIDKQRARLLVGPADFIHRTHPSNSSIGGDPSSG